MMNEELPLHTNKVVALKKAAKTKAAKAIAKNDPQMAIDSLTGLQKAFVEEYMKDLNASKAIIRAGYNTKYPDKMGNQLLNNPRVRLSIDAIKAARTTHSDVTKDYVLKGIQRAIRLAEEAGNLNALLRGHELLARHLGMFIERTEISGPDGDAIKMEQKIREDVSDFTRTIAGLAKRSGTQ